MGDRTVDERFVDLVKKATPTCQLWMGCMMKDGYGKFTITREHSELAHRYAWKMAGRELPVYPLQLDHTCRVRNCVNVEHLEVVTHLENKRRARRPRCRRGHNLLDESNLYYYTLHETGKKVRRCRACIPLNMAEWKAKQTIK